MYLGVKEFIASYKEPFNRLSRAKKEARKRLKELDISTTSKAGKEALEKETKVVLAEWEQKAIWGKEAHDRIQEKGLKKYPNAIKGEYKKTQGEIDPATVLDINKIEPDTRYYEKWIVDPINNLIGFIDEVYIDKKWNIHITEYKSTKNLNRDYTYMTPIGPKCDYYFSPIDHVIDCKFSQANLQASFYMYILWYYNKKLKPKSITIKHIQLNEETGQIEAVEDHEAPYLLEEVKKLLKNKKK